MSIDHKLKWLLLESYFYLFKARILKLRAFPRLAPSLGEQMQETPLQLNFNKRKELSEISQAIHLASRYTLWESECLVKAIAAMKMLERRNMESTLYLGTAKDDSGKLIAHAWLRSGPYFITGAEGMEKFTVVHTFAKNIS